MNEVMTVLPRFHVGEGLMFDCGQALTLPDGAARHVQVLRMQPGDALQLFDGLGQERLATVTEMGRKHVAVLIGEVIDAPAQELPVQVTLALGMPANDRMDALVEKATELGAHAIQPLVCERSVLRLDGERALKKVAHWQAVAMAACEQSGRAVVPRVHPVQPLLGWLKHQDGLAVGGMLRGVLSLRETISVRAWLGQAGVWGRAQGHEGLPMRQAAVAPWGATSTPTPTTAPPSSAPDIFFLSGPEGGLSAAEEQAARDLGWTALSLGQRVLRADTAPLAALSVIACAYEG